MPHLGDELRSQPRDVGIVAMEIYFPSLFVDQSKLEEFDGVSSGKYTKGLGQLQMGFCSDNEDINSLCLTVLANLVEKNGISYSDIGEKMNVFRQFSDVSRCIPIGDRIATSAIDCAMH